MGSSKRQRNRGFLLTETGKLKLETARQKAERLENQGKRYTVEQLSQITELDLSTITRILNNSTRSDRRTLERLFQGFNLKLEAEDFYKPQLKSNSQLKSFNLPVYYPVSNSNIYGRQAELEQLTEYLTVSQAIILYGIKGIGKTAIAAELVDRVKDDFKYVGWRSLTANSSLEVVSAILEQFSVNVDDAGLETKVAWLVSFMQQHRCLLVFDNVDTILDRDAKSEFTAFFSYLSTVVHQSSIILISSRRLNTVTLTKSQSLVIDGLSLEAVTMMFCDRGITVGDRTLTKLTKFYDAHPLSLHLAAATIEDVFNSDVKEFLAQKIAIFSEIEKVLNKQFEQLSELEISTLCWLVVNGEPVSLEQLREDTKFPPRQIVECLRRLQDYLFIDKFAQSFAIQPLIKKYIINHLVERVCREIEREQIEFLTNNALMKATAPDFIRQQQVESIIKPITERLLVHLGRDCLLNNLANLLNKQRKHTPRKPGYLAGNIFNLLRYLKTDLCRWNFSNLSVWQADGRGIDLRQCNFAFADLTQSRFTEDFGETLSLAISPDRKQLAACDTNGQIRLWGLQDNRQQLTLGGHSAWTQQVIYSPDGQTLASCSSDRTIRLWNLNSGSCIGVLKSHQGRVRAIAFTPDGQTLASGGDDWVIKLWDVNTQTVRLTLRGHTDNIRSIIISPDGQTLISSGDDGSIRFWSLNGRCWRTIEAHQQPVWTIAMSPDGSFIASGSVDNTVKLWDSNDGSLITTFRHQGSVSQIAFSPDAKQLVSASYDRTVCIWNIATKRRLKTLTHNDWVQSLVFTNDNLITSSRDRQIQHWNIDTEQVQTTVNSYSNGIWAIAVSPDGRQIASTNDEQTIQLWNVDRSKIERVVTGHSKSIWSVAYSQDNRFLASASDDRTIKIWDVSTGKLHRTIQGDTWFWTVVFSPNSSIVASAGADCSIEFYCLATGNLIDTFTGHTDIIRYIVFDLDGKHLASCGLDNTARVWRIDTGKCIAVFNHPSPVSSVAFSFKQPILATGSDDNLVRLWDITTGQLLQTLSGHTGWVQSIAFSPHNELLASGSHDGTIKLWQTGKAIATLVHGGWVRAIAFRTCSTTKQLQLVSGSGDGTIKLWDVNTRSCLKTLYPPQPYSQMNITGVTGLNESERATLKALGAVETNVAALDNVVYLKQFQTRKSV